MKATRKKLMAILQQIADRNDQSPVEFGDGSTSEEVRLVAELIDDGFLEGGHMEDGMGRPCHATVTGITVQGQEQIQSLKTDVFHTSLLGRAIPLFKYIAVFVLGIVGTLIAQWLAKTLGIN